MIKHVELLISSGAGGALAYANVTFEIGGVPWMARDIKLIERPDGSMIVQMPCRHVTDKCPRCGRLNIIAARFCNYCGVEQPDRSKEADGRPRKRTHDQFFPLTQEGRHQITEAVIGAYRRRTEPVASR